MIEKVAGATVITGYDQDRYAILTLRSALELECKGLKMSRGRSAASIVKERFGYKGHNTKLLLQLNSFVETEVRPKMNTEEPTLLPDGKPWYRGRT